MNNDSKNDKNYYNFDKKNILLKIVLSLNKRILKLTL